MVRSVINLMYKEVRGLHQAAYILALFAFTSQLLAIVRDRLLAHLFGAGQELDIYYAAFRIPDLLFVLFGSVLSVYVLLPFMDRARETAGDLAARNMISQVFTLFLLSYSAVAMALIIFAPWYVPYLFPGLVESTGTLIILIRILLLQAFLLGLSSLCGVVTQMGHRFVLYAISPLLYNLGIIFGIVALYPVFGLAGLVWGVVLGALGHLLVQVPFVVKSSVAFRITRTLNFGVLRQILAVALPRSFTLSINQIVLLILIGLATTLPAGSVSVFQFAFNLQSVPLAIIGMSYSVAAFPTLSRLLAGNRLTEFNHQLLTAMRHIIFWSVPIVALVIVLRAQIVRVLLGSGAFDWSDTRLTAGVLAVFILSLVAQALLLLLIRAFYASGRTLLPFAVSLIAALGSIISVSWLLRIYSENEGFAVWLQELFRLRDVPGTEVLVLALAFMIGQFIQLLVLFVMAKSTFALRYTPLLRLFGQAVLAAVMAGVAAYVTLLFIVDGINQTTFLGIMLQGGIAACAGIAAAGFTYTVLEAPEVFEIYHSFRAKLFKTDVVAPQPENI